MKRHTEVKKMRLEIEELEEVSPKHPYCWYDPRPM